MTTVTERLRDASDRPVRHLLRCECCGADIVIAVEGIFANPRTGSPQRFCSPACRQAAYRRRRAGLGEDTPLQRSGGRDRGLRPAERGAPLAD